MGQQAVWPTHFGRHLEALLEERDLSAGHFAEHCGMTHEQVTELIAGNCILTTDVALLLGVFFETSPLVWLELQRCCCLNARDRTGADMAVSV